MHGANLYMPAPVTGLNYRTDGQWDVHTEHGTIKAKQVVNAAGMCSILWCVILKCATLFFSSLVNEWVQQLL